MKVILCQHSFSNKITYKINELYNAKKVTVVYNNNSIIRDYEIFSWTFQMTLFNVNKKVLLNLEKYYNYIILLENAISIDTIIRGLNNSVFRNEKANYIVIVKTLKNVSETKHIFSTLWQYRIIHSLLITTEDDKDIKLLHANPYGENHCFKQMNFHPVLETTNIFTVYKLLSGCNLTFLRTNKKLFLMPYCGQGYQFGILDKIVVLLANLTNMTLNLVETTYQMEEILMQNFTIQHKNFSHIDMYCGVNRHEDFYPAYDVSDIVIHDTQEWIVAKAKQLSYRTIFFYVFSLPTWLCIILTIISIAFIIYANNFSLFYSILLSFGIALLQTQAKMKNGVIRFILNLYQLTFLIICYVFQANLIGVLFTPYYEKGVESLEDLVLLNYTTLLFPYVRDQFLATNYSILHSIAHNMEGIMESFAERILKINRGKFATYNYNIILKYTNYGNNTLKSLGSRYMIPYELVLFAKNGPPVMESLNNAIVTLHEAGFFNKILSEAVFHKKVSSVGKVVLTLEHLEYGFDILLFGYVVALLLFLFEIRKNISHFLRIS